MKPQVCRTAMHTISLTTKTILQDFSWGHQLRGPFPAQTQENCWPTSHHWLHTRCLGSPGPWPTTAWVQAGVVPALLTQTSQAPLFFGVQQQESYGRENGIGILWLTIGPTRVLAAAFLCGRAWRHFLGLRDSGYEDPLRQVQPEA